MGQTAEDINECLLNLMQIAESQIAFFKLPIVELGLNDFMDASFHITAERMLWLCNAAWTLSAIITMALSLVWGRGFDKKRPPAIFRQDYRPFPLLYDRNSAPHYCRDVR